MLAKQRDTAIFSSIGKDVAAKKLIISISAYRNIRDLVIPGTGIIKRLPYVKLFGNLIVFDLKKSRDTAPARL
jgi:hypothetical protein